MKKILLLLSALAVMGITSRVRGEACTVSNVSVELISTQSSGGNCLVKFDLTFHLEHNNGNKYIWMHLWSTPAYPAFGYGFPPGETELSAALATIGLSSTSGTPTAFQTSYVPAPGVPVQDGSDGLTLSVTDNGLVDIVKISGIVIVVPNSCANAAPITADVWSTNAQSQNAVHCVNTGIEFIPNDPRITGFKNCSDPRMLNINISTTSPTPIDVTYRLYRDDGDGIFEPGTGDVLVGGPSGPHTISDGSPYAATVGYTGNDTPGEDARIWVSVDNSANSNRVTALFQSNCAPLPVSISLFTARRDGDVVTLLWQTTTEIDNRGFYIERSTGGSFAPVGFVASQAPGGDSHERLTYQFSDPNTVRGITQYRLKQVDMDDRRRYSEIRAVRGEGQDMNLVVYPNPSVDGRVNIAFDDDMEIRDMSVIDMNGRVLKQFNGIAGNYFVVTNLAPGIYTLHITVPATGARTMKKIIVAGH